MTWWETMTDGAWTRADLLAAAQTALTVLGFGVAIIQLWRTARNTEKTRVLLEQNQTKLVRNDLSDRVRALNDVDEDLRSALNDQDHVLVERKMREYAYAASDVLGTMTANPAIDGKQLSAAIKEAIRRLGLAEQAARANKLDDMNIRIYLDRISAASVEARSFLAQNRSKVD